MNQSGFRFSVITVCFNAGKTIARTICSVAAQNYENFEHIIIDGASTDSTKEVVDANTHHRLEWFCEPDSGIYDAMNKGIQRATGDILFFLNADDRFHGPNVLSAVAKTFADSPNLRLVYGDAFLEQGSTLVSYPQPRVLTRKRLAATTICHQALFAHRDTFVAVGKYRTEFPIVSDWDWLYRAVFHERLAIQYIPHNISVIGVHGICRTADFQLEKWHALRQYYTPIEVYCYRLIPKKLAQIRHMTKHVLFLTKHALLCAYSNRYSISTVNWLRDFVNRRILP